MKNKSTYGGVYAAYPNCHIAVRQIDNAYRLHSWLIFKKFDLYGKFAETYADENVVTGGKFSLII